MLNVIRDNVQSFGVKFIVGIVVVVMSLFGVSAYNSQSSNTIATVDGYEVKLDKFQRAFENAREDIRRRYGAQASDYLKMVNLESQVIQQLTSAALLQKSAELNGLAVSDMELAYEIYNNPAFMTDERFDSTKYERNLKNYNTDKIGFERDLKEDLLKQKFLKFVSTGALVSRKSLEEEYRRYDSTMKIEVIEFSPALFANQASVSEKEIEEYYDLHKSDFQQKSQIELSYFILGIKDVQDKINVRPKEIDNYYQNNAVEEFTNKARFHSRHILTRVPQGAGAAADDKAKLKAESLYNQLRKNPARFAALAKQHSQDPGSARNGGDLGWVEEGSFVSEFESQVNQLKINELSKPFKSNFGYHVVQVLGKEAAAVKAFDEVKAEIEVTIRANKAKRRLANQVKKMLSTKAENEVDNETTPEKTLEELAQSVNKTINKTGLFDDTKQLKEIGPSYQLYQEVKGKTINQKGEFKIAGDQQIVVYQVIDSKEPFVKPLGQVRKQVEYYAKEQKKANLAKAKLTEYASSVKSLQAFKQVARSLKTQAVPITFKFADRQVGSLNVTNRFKSEVFRMEPNQAKSVLDSERSFLVFLIEKKKGELTGTSLQQLAGLENIMQNQKSQVVLNSLINRLQEEIEVEYNMVLLNDIGIKLEM